MMKGQQTAHLVTKGGLAAFTLTLRLAAKLVVARARGVKVTVALAALDVVEATGARVRAEVIGAVERPARLGVAELRVGAREAGLLQSAVAAEGASSARRRVVVEVVGAAAEVVSARGASATVVEGVDTRVDTGDVRAALLARAVATEASVSGVVGL